MGTDSTTETGDGASPPCYLSEADLVAPAGEMVPAAVGYLLADVLARIRSARRFAHRLAAVDVVADLTAFETMVGGHQRRLVGRCPETAERPEGLSTDDAADSTAPAAAGRLRDEIAALIERLDGAMADIPDTALAADLRIASDVQRAHLRALA